METNHIYNNSLQEAFTYNETVDVILPYKNISVEGRITSMRGQNLGVTITNQDFDITKDLSITEKYYRISEGLVLKQWKTGQLKDLLIYNRVDVKSNKNKVYYEGHVKEKIMEGIYIQYKINNDIEIEFVSNEDFSKRVSVIGKFSKVFNPNQHEKDYKDYVSRILYEKRRIYQPSKEDISKNESSLKSKFFIYEVKSDGNCLYRALSHQIYGDEENFHIVKDAILDYIELEKDFFSGFITGNDVLQYVNLKRMDGVWGDDIEIQSASEIYKRKIEIYINGDKALKTFHEKEDSYRREKMFDDQHELNSNHNQNGSILLSYHGYKHYNSLVNIGNSSNFHNKNQNYDLDLTSPGEYERKRLEVIERMKERKKKSYINSEFHKEIDEIILINKENTHQNENFYEDFKNKADNSYNPFNECASYDENYEKVLEESKKDYENKEIHDINQQIKSINDENNMESLYQGAIQMIVDNGFTEEEAIIAISVVGLDVDMIFQYLYSQNYR